jgi:hypothetical protein
MSHYFLALKGNVVANVIVPAEIIFVLGFVAIAGSLASVLWLVDKGYLGKKSPTSPQPHPCLSFHDLSLIERQDFKGENANGPMTMVLRRCVRCGTHQIHFLAGVWSLQELARQHSEIEELERMTR